MRKLILLTLLITLFSTTVAAQQDSITLLTVGEDTETGERFGGTASLSLEIEEGKGRVFIDSFPLTRVDTQISTRFAKEVACDFTDVNCDNYNFYYTIRADSSIVGGPSAGGAMTVLTASLLDGQSVDDSTAMTGTINSGGIVGPVSGVEEKIKAARNEGFDKVVIPKWDIATENETNITTDIQGIEVARVGLIEEALREFTGKDYSRDIQPVEPSPKYQDIMEQVAKDLCDRYDTLSENISNETDSRLNTSREARENANDSLASEDYYSAASYCFNANTAIQSYRYDNYTEEEKEEWANSLENQANEFLEEVEEIELETVSDLEASIIVKERLLETINLLEDNETRTESIGYITERYNSAVSWSKFFEFDGREMDLDQEHLRNACLAKINEAEERINHLSLLLTDPTDLREDLRETRRISNEGDYAFCLFRASKTKADANARLSSRALPRGQIGEFIDEKLNVAGHLINQQDRDFPILGYSYYNFANSLVGENPRNALTFAEYSLEMSNLDMYFNSGEGRLMKAKNKYLPEEGRPYFLLGLFIGLAIALGIFTYLLKRKKHKIVRKWRKRND